jgi:AcrR family transcriptional regulator
MARPRTDIEPRIVRAARKHFLSQGVDGASLRSIARDAGTSIGMVFYYFPTKDDLFLAVVEEVYSRFLRDLEGELGEASSIREGLRRVFVRLGETSEGELETLRLVMRESWLSTKRFRGVLERVQRGHLRLLLTTLERGVEQGELDGRVPLPLLLVATGALGAAPQLARRLGRPVSSALALPEPHALAALSIELLFRAVGAPPPAAKATGGAGAPPANETGGAGAPPTNETGGAGAPPTNETVARAAQNKSARAGGAPARPVRSGSRSRRGRRPAR